MYPSSAKTVPYVTGRLLAKLIFPKKVASDKHYCLFCTIVSDKEKHFTTLPVPYLFIFCLYFAHFLLKSKI
jgi:hypothetical protein